MPQGLTPIADKIRSYLSEAQVCKFLGISRFTLYRLKSDRHPIPFMKLRGRYLYDPERVSRWLETTGNMRRSGSAGTVTASSRK